MINYTSWPIILSNMKAIGSMTLEELHWQSEAGQKNGQTGKLYAPKLLRLKTTDMSGSMMNDGVIWVIVI